MSQTADFFQTAIKRAIEEEVRNRLEEQIAYARETLAQNLRDSVARVVIGVMQNYSVERMGTDLIIKVKMPQ